jgi:hypothetical protein
VRTIWRVGGHEASRSIIALETSQRLTQLQDVANHQIRHLRALLIEDTINFERKYHKSRKGRGRYNLNYARHWYLRSKAALKREPPAISRSNSNLEAFVSAVLRSLLPDSTDQFPDTFNLDNDRLRALKAEIQDLMYENICCQILKHLVERRGTKYVTEEAQMNLRSDIQKLIGEGRFLALPIGNISVELVRHALRLSGSDAKYDAKLMDLAEEWLQQAHSDPQVYKKHNESLMADLCGEVFSCVEKFLTSSPWDIFNALVASTTSTQPTGPSVAPVGPTGPHQPLRRTDIVHRIAHIAVLHWRTWEDIAYNDATIKPAPLSVPPTATPGMLSRPPTPLVQVAAQLRPLQKPADTNPHTTPAKGNEQPTEPTQA